MNPRLTCPSCGKPKEKDAKHCKTCYLANPRGPRLGGKMPEVFDEFDDPIDNLIEAMFRHGLHSARKGDLLDQQWIQVTGPWIVEALQQAARKAGQPG